VFLLENFNEVVSDTLIEIFTTEMGITCSSEHLEHTVVDGKDGYIESTTAEIKDNNILFVFLIESVGDSGCGGLVDNAEHFKSSNLACVFSCLSLRVVEVGGYGDYGVLDSLT